MTNQLITLAILLALMATQTVAYTVDKTSSSMIVRGTGGPFTESITIPAGYLSGRMFVTGCASNYVTLKKGSDVIAKYKENPGLLNQLSGPLCISSADCEGVWEVSGDCSVGITVMYVFYPNSYPIESKSSAEHLSGMGIPSVIMSLLLL